MKTTFNGTPFIDLFEKLPEIDKDADKENIKIFGDYETMCSNQTRHTCTLCGKKVSIDDSVSSKGHKLICTQCVYKYFEGDYSAVFEWNKEEKNDLYRN